MTRAATHSRFGNRWLVLVASALGLFIVIIDSTIVNVSIPAIITGLHTDLARVEWVVNAYTLVFAALLIPGGRLGDIYGRKLLFLIGLAIFGGASAACGAAPTGELLIIARVTQAFGAAAMLPATLSLVQVNFPPAERGTAFGIWAAISGFAVGIGPALGGLLTQYSWRFIFYVNVPIAAATFLFTLAVVPESKDPGHHRVDWIGAFVWVLALVALNYGLIQGPSAHWQGWIPWFFVSAAVLIVAFVLWERRTREPMMQLSLFRTSSFSLGNAAMAMLLLGVVGAFFLAPLLMQEGLGYGVLATGLALAPTAIVLMTVGPIAGRLSDRFQPRLFITTGLLILSASLLWLTTISVSDTPIALVPRFTLMGLGAGLTISPLTNAVMSTVPRDYAGAASGMLSTSQRVGAVLGVAILGAVFQVSLSSGLIAGLERLPGLTPTIAMRVVAAEEASRSGITGGERSLWRALSSAGVPADERARLEPRLRTLARTAFTHAASLAFRVESAIVFAAAMMSLFVRPARGPAAGESGGEPGGV